MTDPSKINIVGTTTALYESFTKTGISADAQLTPYEAAAAYAALSGACLAGSIAFVSVLISKGIVLPDQRVSLQEIAELTKGQEGSEVFSKAITDDSQEVLAPYRSNWDMEIKEPTERSDMDEGYYRILQRSSSARFTDCKFSTLEYHLSTNTWTTLSNCSGSYLDMYVGSCAELNIRNASFYNRAKIEVSTGNDVDVTVRAEYLDILVSSCSWFKFAVNNYIGGTGPYLKGIDIHVATANGDHEHSLRLPLKGFDGEDLYYHLTGQTPDISEELWPHIIDSYQSGCVKLNVTLGLGAPLELRAR
ncbi:MAG: hypothetical protein LKI98_06915 [Bifidobacterium crudilactis]|jgi:hypothetical protein|nr:hypothetical protein [Bifidobacterium crudilactis]MCI1890152.1 hypothetical protein [Bifidobacterium crudilactis]